MRLKAFKNFGDTPIVHDVSVVVIENDDGKPIAVACNVGPGMDTVAHAGDPEFNRILHTLGFDKVIIANVLDSHLSKPDNMPLIMES